MYADTAAIEFSLSDGTLSTVESNATVVSSDENVFTARAADGATPAQITGHVATIESIATAPILTTSSTGKSNPSVRDWFLAFSGISSSQFDRYIAEWQTNSNFNARSATMTAIAFMIDTDNVSTNNTTDNTISFTFKDLADSSTKLTTLWNQKLNANNLNIKADISGGRLRLQNKNVNKGTDSYIRLQLISDTTASASNTTNVMTIGNSSYSYKARPEAIELRTNYGITAGMSAKEAFARIFSGNDSSKLSLFETYLAANATGTDKAETAFAIKFASTKTSSGSFNYTTVNFAFSDLGKTSTFQSLMNEKLTGTGLTFDANEMTLNNSTQGTSAFIAYSIVEDSFKVGDAPHDFAVDPTPITFEAVSGGLDLSTDKMSKIMMQALGISSEGDYEDYLANITDTVTTAFNLKFWDGFSTTTVGITYGDLKGSLNNFYEKIVAISDTTKLEVELDSTNGYISIKNTDTEHGAAEKHVSLSVENITLGDDNHKLGKYATVSTPNINSSILSEGTNAGNFIKNVFMQKIGAAASDVTNSIDYYATRSDTKDLSAFTINFSDTDNHGAAISFAFSDLKSADTTSFVDLLNSKFSAASLKIQASLEEGKLKFTSTNFSSDYKVAYSLGEVKLGTGNYLLGSPGSESQVTTATQEGLTDATTNQQWLNKILGITDADASAVDWTLYATDTSPALTLTINYSQDENTHQVVSKDLTFSYEDLLSTDTFSETLKRKIDNDDDLSSTIVAKISGNKLTFTNTRIGAQSVVGYSITSQFDDNHKIGTKPTISASIPPGDNGNLTLLEYFKTQNPEIWTDTTCLNALRDCTETAFTITLSNSKGSATGGETSTSITVSYSDIACNTKTLSSILENLDDKFSSIGVIKKGDVYTNEKAGDDSKIEFEFGSVTSYTYNTGTTDEAGNQITNTIDLSRTSNGVNNLYGSSAYNVSSDGAVGTTHVPLSTVTTNLNNFWNAGAAVKGTTLSNSGVLEDNLANIIGAGASSAAYSKAGPSYSDMETNMKAFFSARDNNGETTVTEETLKNNFITFFNNKTTDSKSGIGLSYTTALNRAKTFFYGSSSETIKSVQGTDTVVVFDDSSTKITDEDSFEYDGVVYSNFKKTGKPAASTYINPPTNVTVTYKELLEGFTITELVSKINTLGTNVRATYDSVRDKLSIYNKESGYNNQIRIGIESNSSYSSSNPVGTRTANFLNAWGLRKSTNGEIEKLGSVSDLSTIDYYFEAGKTSMLAGQDAVARIDGIDYTNLDSNSVSVNGVTYNFVRTTTEVGSDGKVVTNDATKINVAVSQDSTKIADNVKSFVEKYNTLLSTLYKWYDEKPNSDYKPLTESQRSAMKEEQIEKWEEKAKAGLLYHDRTLGNLITEIRNGISEKVEGTNSKYNTIFSIGVSTTGLKGQLTIDTDKLNKALADDPDAVYNIFAKLDTGQTYYRLKDSAGNEMWSTERYRTDGYNIEVTDADGNIVTKTTERTSYNGIAQRLGDILTKGMKNIKSVSGSSDSVSEDSDLNNLLKELQTKMSNFQRMMKAFETRLYKKYDAMESSLALLGAQLNYVTGAFSQ